MFRRAATVTVLLAVASCGGNSAAEITRLSGELEREAAPYLLTRLVPEAPAVPEKEPDRMLAVLSREVEKTAGAGFERFRSDAFRGAMSRLRSWVAEDEWSAEQAAEVVETISRILRASPRPREAWWGVSLAKQAELRERLGEDPDDDDALDAWRVLRRHLDPDAPDLAGLRREARGGDNPILAAAAAEILLAAERLPAIDEGRKRDLEAVLLAIRALEYRRENGELPGDLLTVRPEVVPPSPLGMRWELDTDPITKAPAIFLRGGKRFGAAEGDPKGFHADGPEESLFRFGK